MRLDYPDIWGFYLWRASEQSSVNRIIQRSIRELFRSFSRLIDRARLVCRSLRVRVNDRHS